VYGKTKAAVLTAMHRVRIDAIRGAAADHPPTVQAYLTDWVDHTKKPQLRLGTYDSYRYAIRTHVVPWIGRHRLDALTPVIMQGWLAALQAAAVSARSATYARNVLRNALNDALRLELVTRNVAALAQPPASDSSGSNRARCEPGAEPDRRCGRHFARAVHRAGGRVGLRPGELLALRWQDVDFEGGTSGSAARWLVARVSDS
jgi:integrase